MAGAFCCDDLVDWLNMNSIEPTQHRRVVIVIQVFCYAFAHVVVHVVHLITITQLVNHIFRYVIRILHQFANVALALTELKKHMLKSENTYIFAKILQ